MFIHCIVLCVAFFFWSPFWGDSHSLSISILVIDHLQQAVDQPSRSNGKVWVGFSQNRIHAIRNGISFKTMIYILGRKSQPPPQQSQRKELKGERDGQNFEGTKSSLCFLSSFQGFIPYSLFSSLFTETTTTTPPIWKVLLDAELHWSSPSSSLSPLAWFPLSYV